MYFQCRNLDLQQRYYPPSRPQNNNNLPWTVPLQKTLKTQVSGGYSPAPHLEDPWTDFRYVLYEGEFLQDHLRVLWLSPVTTISPALQTRISFSITDAVWTWKSTVLLYIISLIKGSQC